MKASSKAMQKRQNKLHQCNEALEGNVDTATNRGLRMNKGVMCTHEQKKLRLSAYYDERRVLEDDIQTEPIECHMEVKKWEQELWEMP